MSSDPLQQLTESGIAKILTTLQDEDKYISELADTVDVTYSHTHKLVNDLEEHGYLHQSKENGTINCSLTDKGEQVSNIITDLKDLQ